MFKILKSLLPPPQWRIPVIVVLGVFLGISIVIVHSAKATSYLSEDPNACMNCHVMQPQYATWQKSSHREYAACNDCHVPQDNIVAHYWFKMNDGLRHSYMFTFGLEPQAIRIHEAGQRVVQENCKRCHEHVIHQVSLYTNKDMDPTHKEERLCWDCHRYTPHDIRNSLSSTPHARIPQLEPLLPEWMIDRILKHPNDSLDAPGASKE